MPGSKKQKKNAAAAAINRIVNVPKPMPAKGRGSNGGKQRQLIRSGGMNNFTPGSRARSAPTAFGYKNSSRQTYFRSKKPTLKGATVAFSGCDYVGAENSATTLQDFYFAVTPINGAFTKLSTIAPVFAMYRFTKLRVIVEGKTPSTVPGLIAVSGEYDANGTLAAWTQAQVRNQEGVKACKFWEDMVYDYDTRKNSYNWYHHEIGASEPAGLTTEIQGDIHCVADGISATFYTAGYPLVDIWVEYEIEFAESIASGAPQVDLVINDAMKNKVFRSYVSNLAAKFVGPQRLEFLRKKDVYLKVHVGVFSGTSQDAEDAAARAMLGKVDPTFLPPLPETKSALSVQSTPIGRY